MATAVGAEHPAIVHFSAPKLEAEERIENIAEKLETSFDPVKLKEKYLEERDKRLRRNQGVEQYRLIDGAFNHYLKDPWIEPIGDRSPVDRTVEVVIVGGGYGAQLVAVRLLEAGIKDIQIVEKAGDFGGTW